MYTLLMILQIEQCCASFKKNCNEMGIHRNGAKSIYVHIVFFSIKYFKNFS